MSRTVIVDFHNHHVPPAFRPTTADHAPPSQKARWEVINRTLADEALLVADIESGDIDARVVNIPAALIADGQGQVPPDVFPRLNDALAALVDRHPSRIHGLASVDAYAGEAAARELQRAVRDLGLRGVFVDSAKGDRLIDAPEARPTLAAAAELGIPVFVHPVNPQPLSSQLAPYGRLGTLLARGTVNAAALIALVESGTFTALPDLQVVVTTLAFGGIALSGAFGEDSKAPGGALEVLRRHVYVDTMGFNPALIRASVDLLGASHVLAGSDWPIVNAGPTRPVLNRALAAAGLSEADQRLVAGENALRLLGVRPASGAGAERQVEATA